jgi:hypothetical protein
VTWRTAAASRSGCGSRSAVTGGWPGRPGGPGQVVTHHSCRTSSTSTTASPRPPGWTSAVSLCALAVLPEHRGHGYIDDILAEGTRVLCEQDAPRIRATTDVGNVPMAKAFQRAGYVNFEREINMTWS